MKASELRIGNYYFVIGTIDGFGSVTVQYATSYDIRVLEEHPDWGNPIPLTEEWLLKFGFKEGNLTYSEAYSLSVRDTDFYLRPCYRGGYYWGFNLENKPDCEIVDCLNIEYVHQLQNLYFALTGNELTLKTE
jgi:hypothetical protein